MPSQVLQIAKRLAPKWPPMDCTLDPDRVQDAQAGAIRRGLKRSADEQLPRAQRIRLPRECRFDSRDELGGAA